MALNKIDGSPLMQPKILEQFQKGSRTDGETGKSRDMTSQIGQPEAPRDQAQISARGRQLDDLRRTLAASRQALAAIPDVRQERLAQVRARLQAGFYDSDEVRQQVSARLGAVLKRLDSLID